MAGFADATKVVETADPATFGAELDPQWTVTGRPNGGYLLAVLARAADLALDDVNHPYPLAASAHFLAGATVGPATVTIDRLRTGRTVSQVRARLVQDGRQCMEALLTMGRLDPDATAYWSGEPPVPLPAPAECTRMPAQPPGLDFRIGMYDAVELRLDPAGLGYTRGRPDRSGELRGWLRFADDMPPDPLSLLFVADALPPATLTVHPSGWVPTLELTVYVRALPADGPLRVRQRARLIESAPATAPGPARSGLRSEATREDRAQEAPGPARAERAPTNIVDEVCDIWDSRGRLVAQATQLASVRFTP